MSSTQLRCEPLAFLNQLFHLDAVKMTVRGNGLSLIRKTEFGVFFQTQQLGDPCLSDPVSSLTIDPGQIQAIYAMISRSGGLPTIEFEFAGGQFPLSIQPASTPGNAVVIQRIIEAFGDRGVSTSRLESCGAGAWLDEWNILPEVSRHTRDVDLREAIELSTALRVVVELPGLQAIGELRPSFVDEDGSVMRVNDFESGDAVFVDLMSPANQFQNNYGEVHLTHQPKPDFQPSAERQLSPLELVI